MNSDSKYHGLNETPTWRWATYTALFIVVLLLLSHTLKDRTLFWGGMVGGVVVTISFLGFNAILGNPRSRAFILRNLSLLIAIYAIASIALFIWDLLARE